MLLGVMSPVLGGVSLEEMIKYLSSIGVQALELGCGGYPGKAHCDAADFLAHPEIRQEDPAFETFCDQLEEIMQASAKAIK